MIDLDDFREEYREALLAANEYKRRCEKGLPADRLTDGTAGAKMVAEGIRAMQIIMALQTQAISEMFSDMQSRGKDAMRLHSADQ